VRQYLLNDDGILNAGNYLSRTTAGSAGLNVNIEHPLQPLRPGHSHMALDGRFLVLILCDFLTTLAPLRWGHQRSVFAIRGEYTMKTCQVDSGFGHQGRQFRDEVDRLGDDVSGAIPVGRFQLVPNLSLVRL